MTDSVSHPTPRTQDEREGLEYVIAFTLARWDDGDLPSEVVENDWRLSEFLADELMRCASFDIRPHNEPAGNPAIEIARVAADLAAVTRQPYDVIVKTLTSLLARDVGGDSPAEETK